MTAAWRKMPTPARTFLVADRYQITSELAFYGPRGAPSYNVNLGRRLNQYDFWEGPDARRGWDAIVVQEGAGELDERVGQAFERIEGPALVDIPRRERPFALYRAYGFRGFAPPPGAATY